MISAGSRDVYFPVYYVHPFKGNESAFGFDLVSHPARLAALEKARDTGRMVASSLLNLVQLKEASTGILLLAPVYRQKIPNDTVEQRRQNLDGFAIGVVRIASMISGIYSSKTNQRLKSAVGVDLYLYDLAEEASRQNIYIHHSRTRTEKAPPLSLKEARSDAHVAHSLTVGERKWTIVAKPILPDFGVGIPWESWTSLLVVMTLSSMLALYLVTISRRTQVINGLVESRTSELNTTADKLLDREERINAILDNVIDGIITIDSKGTVKTFNPAASAIFGFTAEEVIGQNVKMQMPEPYHGEHDGYLQSYLKTGSAKVIGIGREVVGQRKDGSTFPMELAVGEMALAGKRMFTGIVRDITERKQAENVKAEFVSTVSHELRTPLTSIKGSLGLIKSGAIGELPEKLGSMLDIAYNNSERLIRLINDILDIEKIEAGKMDFHMEPMSVAPLIEQAIEANKGYADEHQVTFVLTNVVQDAMINGDQDRLMQVLANLMSNAAKFAPEHDQIEIAMASNNGGFRVSVTDHGPGIPEEFRKLIFKRFEQADSSDTRKKGGTGLGLSIAQAIVQRHGGTISFETEIGEGTTFYFDLPEMTATDTALTFSDVDGNGYRVLICEDEADIAKLLEMMLKQEGFRTDVARTASEAKELLERNSYDAMTLDLRLPDQDGISLLKEIRSLPETQAMPIIVVSAKASEGVKELNGDAIGIIDWLEKPIDQARLSSSLHQAIKNADNDKPRILHIEDDPDILAVVSALIGDLASVVACETIAEAKRELEQNTFDLVILDLMLPDGDSEQLLPLLHRSDHQSTPVIIFSAKDITGGIAGNIHAILIKSRTTNEALVETIRSAIEMDKKKQES